MFLGRFRIIRREQLPQDGRKIQDSLEAENYSLRWPSEISDFQESPFRLGSWLGLLIHRKWGFETVSLGSGRTGS